MDHFVAEMPHDILYQMSGSDFLSLDPAKAPSRGKTSWLAQQLRLAISEGALQAGSRLPATRVLAGELSLGRGTVVEAYRRLVEEGLLVTNLGGGTSVAEIAVARGSSTETNPGITPPKSLLNISAGIPDTSMFPRAAWLRAERRVLSTATEHEFGYADPQGTFKLRAALAGWLARSRGLSVGPDRIIITAGVTGGLSLLAQVLREQGTVECAVEDPGANGNRRILQHWLDKLHPIPVDGEGIDVLTLAKSQVRAVLVTPAHQFPTGVVLSPPRRRALITWAEQTNGLVIEDDYDAEYRYDRAPVRAMHSMAPERVVHVSSLSKALAPALRLGWMIAPSYLHGPLIHKRWATDLGSPVLVQLTLAELIQTGVFERHLRTLRMRHRKRRDAAVEAIRRYMPGCTVEGIAAGLHLVVRLPECLDDAIFATKAKAVGIAVQPLSAHRIGAGEPGLVIGYGGYSAPKLEEAIKTLGTLLP